MAALNEAYASGSLVEMIALSDPDSEEIGLNTEEDHTAEEMARALEKELARIQRKQRLVQNEIETLHNNPVVQLSLDIKLARRRGRDLLAEMGADLELRIARAVDERDQLKARLDRLRR